MREEEGDRRQKTGHAKYQCIVNYCMYVGRYDEIRLALLFAGGRPRAIVNPPGLLLTLLVILVRIAWTLPSALRVYTYAYR